MLRSSAFSCNRILLASSSSSALFTPTCIALRSNYKIVIDEEESRTFAPKFINNKRTMSPPSSLSSLFSSQTQQQRQRQRCFGQSNSDQEREVSAVNNNNAKRNKVLKRYVENAFESRTLEEPVTTSTPTTLIQEKKKKVLEARRDLKIALKELRSAAKKNTNKQ